MRTLKSRSKTIVGGVAMALVVTSGTLAVTTAPSWAVVATLSQTAGPAAGTNKMVVSGATFTSASAVEFTSAACGSTYTSVAAGIVAATAVALNNPATSITVTVPALTAGAWNVCVYAGNSAGSSAQQAV